MKRSSANPVLTRADIPGDVTSVFNPGAVRHDGRELLMLRVQTRARRTQLMIAEHHGEERYTVRPEPVHIPELPDSIYHAYDPRLTPIDGEVLIQFACDTDAGCRLGLARTADFENFELVGMDASGDRRNGVIFPERIDGRYARLERPNLVRPEGGPPTGSQIVLATSDDLIHWYEMGPVMSGRPRYWDELIGSGPPPVKTRSGWLHVYHGVATHFAAAQVYQAGVALLDLDDPRRLLARSRENILEPRELYEQVGQVPNVIFPSGLIVERVDEQGFALPESPARLYYGAADTVVGLAQTTIEELLERCR